MINKIIAIHAVAPGVSIATSATSASVAIPKDLSGNPPRYIRVAATAAAAIKIGSGTQLASSADVLVQPGDALILSVGSATDIAAIQISVTGFVVITPLENQ